jgi:hypothetical protein
MPISPSPHVRSDIQPIEVRQDLSRPSLGGVTPPEELMAMNLRATGQMSLPRGFEGFLRRKGPRTTVRTMGGWVMVYGV